jgi:hypothetical protein
MGVRSHKSDRVPRDGDGRKAVPPTPTRIGL